MYPTRLASTHGSVFTNSATAMTSSREARNAGRAELYADAATGRLRGALLVGPDMDHIAHLLAWSVQQRLTAMDVLQMPFFHPTMEEGLKPALLEICKATNASQPSDRNDGFIPGRQREGAPNGAPTDANRPVAGNPSSSIVFALKTRLAS